MIGLLLLKSIYRLSDEAVCERVGGEPLLLVFHRAPTRLFRPV